MGTFVGKKKGFNHRYHMIKLGLSESKINEEMDAWLERELEREKKKNITRHLFIGLLMESFSVKPG